MAEERTLTIDDLRQRIDQIDEQLVRLLNDRADCALAVGVRKQEAGMEIYQPSREAEVLAHVQAVNTGPLDDGAVKRLFERVIDENRRLERLANQRLPRPGVGRRREDEDR